MTLNLSSSGLYSLWHPPQDPDGRLAVLLELSDYTSIVLDKVDQILPAEVFGEPFNVATPIFAPLKDSEHQSARTRTRGRLTSTGRKYDSSQDLLWQAPPGQGQGQGSASATCTPQVAAQQAADAAAAAAASNFPSVVSAVYALRRGGTRQETLSAVDNLIQLCNFGGELCLPAVKQMLAAGNNLTC